MEAPTSPKPPRLVTRFALSSLVAFLAIGAALSWLVSEQLRGRQEDLARSHAEVVANSVLRYVFETDDLAQPLTVTGARYHRLLRVVRERVLNDPVMKVV